LQAHRKEVFADIAVLPFCENSHQLAQKSVDFSQQLEMSGLIMNNNFTHHLHTESPKQQGSESNTASWLLQGMLADIMSSLQPGVLSACCSHSIELFPKTKCPRAQQPWQQNVQFLLVYSLHGLNHDILMQCHSS